MHKDWICVQLYLLRYLFWSLAMLSTPALFFVIVDIRLCVTRLEMFYQRDHSKVWALEYNQWCKERTHTFLCLLCCLEGIKLWVRVFQISIVKPRWGVSRSASCDGRKLEQRKLHYRWVMFSHRCVSQCVPWHFGQLQDSLWFVCTVIRKNGNPNQTCASSYKTTLSTSILLCTKGSKCL